MAQMFSTQEQDQEFKNWLAQHPHGFYLNKRGGSEMMLHKVGCFHLGDGAEMVSTTRAKVASDNREELVEWAKANDMNVVACNSRCL